MTIGIWILGDQLWHNQAALASAPEAPVILIESQRHSTERRYHRQKLVLVWSAMRHFAAELKAAGRTVAYEVTDDFATPLHQWLNHNKITELRVMEPADRPFARFLNTLKLPCQLTLVPNNHFLWSVTEFKQWADGRKRLLMESFYREGRKRYGILMAETTPKPTPIGGQWNYDKENRKPPKKGMNPPAPQWFEPELEYRAIASPRSYSSGRDRLSSTKPAA